MRSFKNYLEAKAPILTPPTIPRGTRSSTNLNLPDLLDARQSAYGRDNYNNDYDTSSYSGAAQNFSNRMMKTLDKNERDVHEKVNLLENCKYLAEQIVAVIIQRERTGAFSGATESDFRGAKLSADKKFITNIQLKDISRGRTPNFTSIDIQKAIELKVFTPDPITQTYTINIDNLRLVMNQTIKDLEGMSDKYKKMNNQNKGIYKIGQTMDNISGRLKGQGSVPNYGNAR